MEDSLKEKILELMEELGAHTYIKGENWKGYEVYIPSYQENVYMGLPYVVLVKDDKTRISTPEESLDYLYYSNPEIVSDKKLYD